MFLMFEQMGLKLQLDACMRSQTIDNGKMRMSDVRTQMRLKDYSYFILCRSEACVLKRSTTYESVILRYEQMALVGSIRYYEKQAFTSLGRGTVTAR